MHINLFILQQSRIEVIQIEVILNEVIQIEVILNEMIQIEVILNRRTDIQPFSRI